VKLLAQACNGAREFKSALANIFAVLVSRMLFFHGAAESILRTSRSCA
jgi:hypothetical protein